MQEIELDEEVILILTTVTVVQTTRRYEKRSRNFVADVQQRGVRNIDNAKVACETRDDITGERILFSSPHENYSPEMLQAIQRELDSPEQQPA